MVKISIITATYNSEKTIEQTILSVASQSYANIEHVIVDGKSTDRTLEIIKRLQHPKLIYISEKDKGIYDALNKGVAMATGDVIGVIGSDDFYPHGDVIQKVADAFAKKNTDSLYGDIQYINDSNKIIRDWRSGNYRIANFLKGWMPPHLSFYLKKDAYLTYGLYKDNFRISGDYELMLRMLYKHRISTQYLPEVLAIMRVGGASTRSFSNRIKANLEDRRAWIINNLDPRFYTLFLKPILKIPQFFKVPNKEIG
jgi:glycosyltransferase involved in cell wall biosynthesis